MKTVSIKPNSLGWKCPNKNISIVGYTSTGDRRDYHVVCSICSKDKELFPFDYFISQKPRLLKGILPCGCSERYRYTYEQYLIRLKRVIPDHYIILKMYSEFRGNLTILEVKCLLDNKTFYPTINSFLSGSGCPLCGGNALPDENTLLLQCNDAAIRHGYIPVGFKKDGIFNNKTKYSYFCKSHGVQHVRPYYLINNLSKCPDCKREIIPYFGYYDLLKEKNDFLYILNFNDEYIKIGRSFDVARRIADLKLKSKCTNISCIALYSGLHWQVWDIEQQCHKHLRLLGYEHLESLWTNETFCFESAFIAIDFIKSFNLTPTSI